MKEQVLWAVKIGEEDWQEELVTSTASALHLAKAKAWALNNGFNRLRVSGIDLNEKPNFCKVFNR